jgi:hypothetical protein
MTQGAEEAIKNSPSQPHHSTPPGATRGRIAVIVVLVVALVAAAGARQLTQADRARAIYGNRAQEYAGASLSSMNSFALALLLGGLRGPLVMFLWTQSENAKNEKNLEGVDTQIEWIRLLQPEFDTVHLFQIWNKAYNLSVQMASLSNKYITILDAIDYAKNVDRERPDDINIITAIAQTYFDKLGNSAEKDYYRRRVRSETLPHENRQKLRRGDPGYRRLQMDTMLTAQGQILPQYEQELKYLKPYQPFPYGLSPLALAYNYYKEAQRLQNLGQRHIQQSPMVVDSRPALALKNWSEAEWERGRRFELQAFSKPIPTERIPMELPTADLPVSTKIADPSAIPGALFSYRIAGRLARDAQVEYWNHIDKYKTNLFTYLSHIDDMQLVDPMTTADADYLEAVQAPAGAQRDAHLRDAADHYQKARNKARQIILKYYIDDQLLEAALPKGYTKADIVDPGKDVAHPLPADQYAQVIAHAMAALHQSGGADMHAEDRSEYETYITRATDRLNQIHAVLPAGPTGSPATTQSAR